MPNPSTPTINLDVLRDVLAGAESMVAYYERSDEKALQNAALKAAGLTPLHSEDLLEWDRRNAAGKRREVECLKAVLAFLTPAGTKPEAA